MGAVTVVVPWRDSGCPHRLRNFRYTLRHISKTLPEAEIVISDPEPSEPFNRGRARNRGVELATGDVVVLWDADTLVEELPLREALYEAQMDSLMHLPYENYRCLTPSATKKALRGLDLVGLKSEWETEWGGSGVVVIRPEAYWVAGQQPEFEGWGFEDAIFKICADTLLGKSVRHAGTVHHLWHPKSWNFDDPDYIRNREWGEKYDRAEGDVEAVKALTEERS